MKKSIYLFLFTCLISCTNTTPLLTKHKTFTHKGQIKNGTYIEVDSLGRFDFVHFENGKLHGSYVKYYQTGEVWIAGNYSKGKKDGDWSYYFIEGIMARVDTYKKGKCISKMLNGCPKF